MSNTAFIETALLAGLVYASLRILLSIFYPTVAGYCWQFVCGPAIAKRWPAFAQSEDMKRLSYLGDGQPLEVVWHFGSLPPPIEDITQGLRDGLLIGVLIAFVPQAFAAFMTLLLLFVFARQIWLITCAEGAWRTDAALWAGKDVLMWCGMVLALHAMSLLP